MSRLGWFGIIALTIVVWCVFADQGMPWGFAFPGVIVTIVGLWWMIPRFKDWLKIRPHRDVLREFRNQLRRPFQP